MTTQDPKLPQRAQRYTYDAPVTFDLEESGQRIEGRVIDISREGMYAHADTHPPPNSHVVAHFAVPFMDAPIRRRAEVVWVLGAHEVEDESQTGFALRFLSSGEDDPEALRDLDERRRAHRSEYRTDLRFEVEGSARFYTGLVRDISTGGIFVNSYDIPDIGDHVDVLFIVPFHDTPISLNAEVVWICPEDAAATPYDIGFGARFHHLPDAVREAVQRSMRDEETLLFE
jgi:Tfp pilus assembly protein PilZ